MYPARPYCAHKILTLCILAEIVILYAILVNLVALLNFNSCVDYGHKANAL